MPAIISRLIKALKDLRDLGSSVVLLSTKRWCRLRLYYWHVRRALAVMAERCSRGRPKTFSPQVEKVSTVDYLTGRKKIPHTMIEEKASEKIGCWVARPETIWKCGFEIPFGTSRASPEYRGVENLRWFTKRCSPFSTNMSIARAPSPCRTKRFLLGLEEIDKVIKSIVAHWQNTTTFKPRHLQFTVFSDIRDLFAQLPGPTGL